MHDSSKASWKYWEDSCSPLPLVSYAYSEKTMKNSERLGRQALTGIEPDTSRLPVLGAEPVGYWWD